MFDLKSKAIAFFAGLGLIMTAIIQTMRLDKVKGMLKRSEKARDGEQKAAKVVNDVNEQQRKTEDEIQSDNYDPRTWHNRDK